MDNYRLVLANGGESLRLSTLLMADYTPKLKNLLREHGCYFVRPGKGDHEIWFSPTTGVHVVVDSAIRSKHTASAVLKQAGIPKAFYEP